MDDARRTCITGKLPPPVGTSEWETFSQDSLCADKTRMIKEILDLKTRVALFTIPRQRRSSRFDASAPRSGAVGL